MVGTGSIQQDPLTTVTRLVVASRWQAWRAWFEFRRLRRIGHNEIPGLLVTAISRPTPQTVIFVSMWRDEFSLFQFTTLEEHVNAARRAILSGAQVWSAVFRYDGVSSVSKEWVGEPRRWTPSLFHRVTYTHPAEFREDSR